VKINILSEKHSLVSQFISEIRDVRVQQDGLRFRRNIERIGEVTAYEISRHLDFHDVEVETPLGVAGCRQLAEQPVLGAILRAALPLHQGLLNYFDKADNAFISAYRRHFEDGHDFDVHIEYLSCPPLNGRTVILCDPMLASGQSMVLAWKALLERGRPARLHVVVVIASRQGIEYARQHLPEDTTLWVAAVDEELDANAYIVPGLGDAGDLAYGAKD
jgi:uracil phosphoribosyltransferase